MCCFIIGDFRIDRLESRGVSVEDVVGSCRIRLYINVYDAWLAIICDLLGGF